MKRENYFVVVSLNRVSHGRGKTLNHCQVREGGTIIQCIISIKFYAYLVLRLMVPIAVLNHKNVYIESLPIRHDFSQTDSTGNTSKTEQHQNPNMLRNVFILSPHMWASKYKCVSIPFLLPLNSLSLQ